MHKQLDPGAEPRLIGSEGKPRLIGIDAARGLALIGLMAIHILPEAQANGEPTWTWNLFAGDSAALFALLAGVGLALSSGGRSPHRDRRMTADRVGLAVRAVIIGIVALVISALLPFDPPAYSILLYYSVFFLLAIPFLPLRPRALFGAAAVFGIGAPILMQQLYPVLPESSAYNHTLVNLVTEPVGVASELLLTGWYPALPYLAYVLVGLGLGRLNLRSTRIQALIAGAGAALAVSANLVSYLLLNFAGGYQALLETPGVTRRRLDQAIAFGPDVVLPDTSGWWLAIATPHTNAPLAIASSLGTGLLVTGLLLLIGARVGRWLTPLAAMGTMTFTLYSAHLLALAPEIHYEQPVLWFVVHVGAAVAFAWIWSRRVGRGPLEAIVSWAVKRAREIVVGDTPHTTTGGPAAQTPDGITENDTDGARRTR